MVGTIAGLFGHKNKKQLEEGESQDQEGFETVKHGAAPATRNPPDMLSSSGMYGKRNG